MENRRSMGMLKPRGQPIRSSGVGSQRLSAAKPSHLKLPKLSITSEGSRRRSSSADPSNQRKSGLNSRRATSSTRSPSLNHTPLAPRMPLNGLANSCSSNRGNGPFGRESMSPYRRELAKGIVKDTRPLSDKLWQAEKAREIIDFCRDNNFPGILSMNSLPLKTNDFRNLFEFLYSFLEPDFKMPRNQDMAHDLPPLLKSIGYQGTVSKSMFQTIGATHSWPMTMGVLHYLYLRAKSLSVIEGGAFQNLEDPIQGESERLVFFYFSRRYNKWMQCDEDDTEDLIALEHDFMNLYEIDTILLRNLEDKLSNLRKENETLKLSTIDMEILNRNLAEKRSDVEKITEYYALKTKQYEHKKDEKLKLEREKLELETKKRLAHSSTTELERFCRQEKGIDPNEGSVVEREVAELQHQLRRKQNSIAEAKVVLCRTEQELSKKVGNVDKLCEQFNISLLNLKIENLVDLRLDRGVSFDHVRDKLRDCFRDYRALEKSMRDGTSRCDAELASLKQILNRKIAEVKKIEDDLRVKQDEHDNIKKEIEKESVQLGAHLEVAKDEFLKHGNRTKRNLRTLESELERAKADLKFVVADNERKVFESSGRVEEAETFAEGEFKRLKEESDKTIKLYMDKVDEVCSNNASKKREMLKLRNFVFEHVSGNPKK